MGLAPRLSSLAIWDQGLAHGASMPPSQHLVGAGDGPGKAKVPRGQKCPLEVVTCWQEARQMRWLYSQALLPP